MKAGDKVRLKQDIRLGNASIFTWLQTSDIFNLVSILADGTGAIQHEGDIGVFIVENTDILEVIQ